MDIQKSQQQQNLQLPQKSPGNNEALDLFYSGKRVLTHFAEAMTISEAIYQPSIRKLVKTNSNEFVGVFIMGLLDEFLSFVPNALTAGENRLYSEKILAHCPDWSTGDLILCLKNGMDGKYGETKYHWKWTVFVEWAKKYEQQKDDFFFKRHVDKTNNAKFENADLIKLFPKELIDQFAKEKVVDQEKRKLLDIKIPKDVVEKGLDAVDKYIEQVRNTKK